MFRPLMLVLGLLFMGVSFAQTAPTVTLTATPTSGISPLSVTLNWSSTNAVTCAASGGWSGAKALSGTQTITGVTATTTYTLTCTAGPGQAVVSWVAPTQNTDGSALTNLAGFKVYWANSSAGVPAATPVVLNSPTTLTYTVTGLTAGTWYFGAKAFNSANVDSDLSGIANKVVTIPSANASTTVTITTKPNPPVVTVAQTAYDLRERWFNVSLGRPVGTIALGVPCDERVLSKKGEHYHAVPPEQVSLYANPRSERLVVSCAAASVT